MVAALMATVAGLGGCDQIRKIAGGGEPKGQVVATLDGEEITVTELRQEMGGFTSRDPATMKAAQQRALQTILLRRVVADAAREQKLDKTPNYTVQLRRGEETLLAQALQQKIAAGIAVPSRAEAETFISQTPERFAGRRILIVDQVIAGPNNIPPERLAPVKTFEELRALLDAEKVSYQSNVSTIDTLSVPPAMLEQVNKLPPGEIFALRRGGGSIFNRVIDSRPAPFTGDEAVAYASNVIRTQKAQQAVASQVQVMRKNAESKIVYNEAYKPPADAKAAPTKK
jgi:EpsD family peptidyl-prolyl cis-trans isomerase